MNGIQIIIGWGDRVKYDCPVKPRRIFRSLEHAPAAPAKSDCRDLGRVDVGILLQVSERRLQISDRLRERQLANPLRSGATGEIRCQGDKAGFREAARDSFRTIAQPVAVMYD